MVAPESPTGGAIRQAIFDHHANGEGDDPIGVVTAGWSQIGEVGWKIFPTDRAEVLRVGKMDFMRATRDQVADIMQRTRVDSLAKRRFVAVRTGVMIMIAVLLDNFGSRQIFDPLKGDIGEVFSRT